MLSQTQLRIACAKLDGFKPIGMERDSRYYTQIPLEIYTKLSEEEQVKQRTCVLLSYTTDLNAIMALIRNQELTLNECSRFRDALMIAHGFNPNYYEWQNSPEFVKIVCSTPEQLCIALLKAKGLYEA
jgi:hypothetical protein